jgi:hypothetical protein
MIIPCVLFFYLHNSVLIHISFNKNLPVLFQIFCILTLVGVNIIKVIKHPITNKLHICLFIMLTVYFLVAILEWFLFYDFRWHYIRFYLWFYFLCFLNNQNFKHHIITWTDRGEAVPPKLMRVLLFQTTMQETSPVTMGGPCQVKELPPFLAKLIPLVAPSLSK